MTPLKPVLLALLVALCACSPSPAPAQKPRRPAMLPASPPTDLSFTCTHEAARIPPRHPEADQLFRHARWLQQHNLIKKDLTVNPVVERLYRIATAWGHDKANHNLANMLMRGQSSASDARELAFDLAQDLIQRGIPQGYYDMGSLLYRGYGVVQDEEAAHRYFRKAADLGNPEAQHYLGRQFRQHFDARTVPFEIGNAMLRCAAEQGHAEAAITAAYNIKNEAEDKRATYADAVKYFHLAVKAGNGIAARALSDSFLAPPPTNELDYLALEKDEERARRYEVLANTLSNYSYLHPAVEDLDEIVPLPPAPLPAWDGKFRYQRDWEANIAPALPREARVNEMATEKGLNPLTGRPMPPLPKPQAHAPLPRWVATGVACPRTGLWRCDNGEVYALQQGQPMPPARRYRAAKGWINRLRGIRLQFSHLSKGQWEWLGHEPP